MGGVSSPVCGKYVHTGRPHSRINKNVFKKIQCDVHSNKKSPEKPEKKKKKINMSTKVKIHKPKYAVTKRCSEKTVVLKID